MNRLVRDPLFVGGLLLRLSLVVLVLPYAALTLYVPFMDLTTRSLVLDPWEAFLASGGSIVAFPYGYVMWGLFLPITVLFKVVGLPMYIGYGLTLIAADLAALVALQSLVQGQTRRLLVAYWWSPIVIMATYWLGLNDIVPIALLCGALLYTRRMRLMRAGLLCGAAVSAKMSMVLVLPFFLIFLLHNKAARRFAPSFAKGLGLALVLFSLPFVSSEAGLSMLLQNPEMVKVYQVALRLGDHTQVYLLPLAYLLMLYAAWRVPRLNFDLLNALFGLSFLLVVLLTSASPGWFIWVVPMLVTYQIASGRVAAVLVGGFSLVFAGINALIMPSPRLLGMSDMVEQLAARVMTMLGDFGVSLLYTGLTALGAVLALRILRETVNANDWFRFSRKPFVIGIAGDSGAGKDTLVDALAGAFGEHSVARLSGDDYHLWDRQRPMWQVMTHLNPMANDLDRFSQDLLALTDGRPIMCQHYNHLTGKMERPHSVGSNHIILVSGLHALYLPILRDCYDLSIYLDMDDVLRRYLKVRRDVGQRGQPIESVLASIERRNADSKKFICPQSRHSDLVMRLEPIHPRLLDDKESKDIPRLRLVVKSRMLLNELAVTRVLIGVCGLHVDLTMNDAGSEAELSIEGETSAEDISLAARLLMPRIIDFLDFEPRWHDGVLGLMQLITLSHVNQALSRRLL
jgi:uridine kinase